MKFGIHLPTGYPACTDVDIQTAINETATVAESLKFDTVWVNDAVTDNAVHGVFHAPIAPLITLASLTHLVPNIALGSAVMVLPQRNPFLVAKQVAALDLLSNERFTFGIGLGWREDEYELLGADFKNRGAVADEFVEVMRELWRESNASFDGQFQQFTDLNMRPKPRSGGPPIWVGGSTEHAYRRAARIGSDGWIPFGLSVDDLKSSVIALRELTQDKNLPTIGLETGVRVYSEGQDPPSSLPPYHFEATIAGYSDQIVEQIRAYQEIGLEHLLCIFYADKLNDQLKQMRLFAEQVMPYFAETEQGNLYLE